MDFLLASIFRDEAADVISEIRAGINLTGRMEASQRLAKGSEKRRQEEGAMSVERLVLDKIRVTVAREKWMGEEAMVRIPPWIACQEWDRCSNKRL